MIRPARAGDEAPIEAFLQKHAETSMFLRGNLADHGLSNKVSTAGTSFFVTTGASIDAVFGITNSGFVMCQAPGVLPEFWLELAKTLHPYKISGITGDVAQVRRIKAAFGLKNFDFSMDDIEPLYRLELDHLIDQGAAKIRKPTEDDMPLLCAWGYAYDTETLGAAKTEETRKSSAGAAKEHLKRGHIRLLIENGKPVAKTNFNAALPDIVQIGAVYTPPDLRSRGYARKVVAAHLKEVQKTGVKTALLFASGKAACRAYEAIGFEHIGEYALTLLKDPHIIKAIP